MMGAVVWLGRSRNVLVDNPRSVAQRDVFALAADPFERQQIATVLQGRAIDEQELVRSGAARQLLQRIDHCRHAFAAGGDGEHAEIADAEVGAEGIGLATAGEIR